MTEEFTTPESQEQKKVTLILKIGRHGVKGPEGDLNPDDTKPFELGQKLGPDTKVYTAWMPRVRHTGAKIFEGAGTSYHDRPRDQLVSQFLLSPDLAKQKDEDYDIWFKRVLDTPKACALTASGIANQIEHFREMAGRLTPRTTINLVQVSHDLETAAFLKEVLVREIDGQEVHGFDDIKEIGGPLDMNEYFEVKIERNDRGNTLSFQFDNPDRLPGVVCKLDLGKVEELARLYKNETAKLVA